MSTVEIMRLIHLLALMTDTADFLEQHSQQNMTLLATMNELASSSSHVMQSMVQNWMPTIATIQPLTSPPPITKVSNGRNIVLQWSLDVCHVNECDDDDDDDDDGMEYCNEENMVCAEMKGIAMFDIVSREDGDDDYEDGGCHDIIWKIRD